MKSYENPYTLTFGIKPDQYISRVQQTEEIIGTLQSENPSVRVYLISGVRGSSKTVLMTNVSDEKIWQELSAIEKDILIAMTQIKSKKVKDIREVLNSKSNDFSVYRTRLIRKGVVYSPSYGELDFTLPLFDKFVLDQA